MEQAFSATAVRELGIATASNSEQVVNFGKRVDDLEARVQELGKEQLLTESAQGYFSDILNAQTGIFTAMVGIFIAASWLYQQKVSSIKIRKEVENSLGRLGAKLKKEFLDEVGSQKKILDLALEEQSGRLDDVRSSALRAIAELRENQSDFGGAFIWWIRAFSASVKAREDRQAEYQLNRATAVLSRIKDAAALDLEYVGEYQRLVAKVDPDRYRIQIQLLETAIKKAVERVDAE